MNIKEKWPLIDSLFHQAMELPPDEREQFVENKCGHDADLKREVWSLVSSVRDGSRFLEDSATGQVASEFLDGLKQVAHDIASGDTSLSDSAAEASSNLPHSQLDDATIQRLLGTEFELIDRINQGAMGLVVEAKDRKLNRRVAIKLIRSGQLDEKAQHRIVRESRAVAKVNSDYIVTLHDVVDQQQAALLVMELIDGPSFREMLNAPIACDYRKSAQIVRDAALGLADAHRAQLIHRDIKPANILVETLNLKTRPSSGDGHPVEFPIRGKLADFGLARSLDGDATSENVFAGTPNFMSPEQLTMPAKIDERSDIYGLGATLYRALTGEPPFRGAPHMLIRQIENSDPIPPRNFDDRIPRDLESICLKALSRDRGKRYASAAEMAADLDRFLTGLPTQARPISTLEKGMRWCQRNRKTAFAMATAALLGLIITIGSLGFAWVVAEKNRQIQSARRLAVQSKVQRIVDADPAALQLAIDSIGTERDAAVAQLNPIHADPQNDLLRRFNAAVALSMLDRPKTGFVVDNLDQLFESPAVCQCILTALRQDPDAAKFLKASLEDPQSDFRSQAKRIILLAHLGEFDPWRSAIANKTDPSLRTEIVHMLPSWHGDISELLEAASQQRENEWVWTICHSIKLTDHRMFKTESVEQLQQTLNALARSTKSAAVRAGCDLAFSRLGSADNAILEPSTPGQTPDAAKAADAPWLFLDNGMRMIRVEPGTASLGRHDTRSRFAGFSPHDVTITRPYYIADAETTRSQFQSFLEYLESHPNQRAKYPMIDWQSWEPSLRTSPSGDHPVQRVSWYDAILFCNWLSEQHGLQPVYEKTGQVTVTTNNDQTMELPIWHGDLSANGYRLPTEAEWEFACRNGSTTPYHFGNQRDLFEHYGIASNFTWLPANPVRATLPNARGMFDFHGNVWEWCHDWFSDLGPEPLVDPSGPTEPDLKNCFKIYRGGGVGTTSGETNSESRGSDYPNVRYDNQGFRIARTAE